MRNSIWARGASSLVIFTLSWSAWADVPGESGGESAGQSVGQSVGQSIETLPPLVIEGSIPHVDVEPAALVAVPAGFGAKTLDPSINALGIELKNAERLEDISAERRLDPWWLKGSGSKVHADLSLDQRIRARTEGSLYGVRAEVEAGLSRNHRDLILEHSNGSPYGPAGGSTENLPNKNDLSWVQVHLPGRSLEGLADADHRYQDTYAGSLYLGSQTVDQQSANGRWRHGPFTVSPFVQTREQGFSSAVNPLFSNSTAGARAGSQLAWKEGDWHLDSSLSYEALSRHFADNSSTKFGRADFGSSVSRSFVNEWLETKWRAGFEFAADEIDSGLAPTVEARGAAAGAEPLIWDAEGEASSTHLVPVGVIARMRRFAFIPTPTERFGDGALLAGSDELAPESGLRAALGPWFKRGDSLIELAAFFEHATNAPVMVAVSPLSARTLAIGGVWTRGLELKAATQLGLWTAHLTYDLQDAVNDSEISWQKGQAVPGRPDQVLQTGFDYGQRGWKMGASYIYESSEALDFGGLWFKPSHHDLNAYVGYGTRSWEMRLTGAKLLASLNGLPTTQFAGQAAPDLLEPTIEQTEIRFQCEFLM